MNSPHVVSVDKPSKGLKVPSKRLRKTSLRDDFWSSSACEMENSTFPSQRSISSISTSNPALDPHSNSGTTSSTSEFVNHGERMAYGLCRNPMHNLRHRLERPYTNLKA
ncbi:hypothetical protein AABB24_011019 [Solanum stoloniferum]